MSKYLTNAHILHTPFKPEDSCIWRAITKVVDSLGKDSHAELVETIYLYGMISGYMMFIFVMRLPMLISMMLIFVFVIFFIVVCGTSKKKMCLTYIPKRMFVPLTHKIAKSIHKVSKRDVGDTQSRACNHAYYPHFNNKKLVITPITRTLTTKRQ